MMTWTIEASGDGWEVARGQSLRVDLFAPLIAQPQIGVDMRLDATPRVIAAAREHLIYRCTFNAPDPAKVEAAIEEAFAHV